MALTFNSSTGITNGTTPVSVVTAPGASIVRVVKTITLYNPDTVARTFAASILDGATPYVFWQVSLAAGESVSWGESVILDTTGKSATVTCGEATTTTDPVFTAAYVEEGAIVLPNLALGDLTDVDSVAPSEADVLTWDNVGGNWVPRTDLQKFITVTDCDSTVYSSSAFSWKGLEITPYVTITFYGLGLHVKPVSGATYQAAIITISGGLVATVLQKTETLTLPTTVDTTKGMMSWLMFSTPVTLTAGTSYAIMFGRTNGGDTYALPMAFPLSGESAGHLPASSSTHHRVASASLAIGSASSASTTGSVFYGAIYSLG